MDSLAVMTATLGSSPVSTAASLVWMATPSSGTFAGTDAVVVEWLAVFTLLGVAGTSSLPGKRGSVTDLAAWIAGGALLAGLFGWGVVTVAIAGGDPTHGLMAGIAVGGGVGAVVRLLAFPPRESRDESITIDAGEGVSTRPEPRPMDLFDASPDPIVFYDVGDEAASALAVNPAYESTFADTGPTGEGTPLSELAGLSHSNSVIDAATNGDRLDSGVQTAESDSAYRLRVVPVGADQSRGYILFTPVSETE